MNVTVWITQEQVQALAKWSLVVQTASIEVTIGDEREGVAIPDDAIFVKQGTAQGTQRALIYENGRTEKVMAGAR